MVRMMLKDYISLFLKSKLLSRKHKVGVYYPSELPYCLRKQYFRYILPKDLSDEQSLLFGTGWVWHQFIYEVLKFSRIKVLNVEKQYKLKASKGCLLDCVVDAEIQIGKRKVVLEIKSVQSLSKIMNEPLREHVLQVTVYMRAARTDHAILFYVDKRTLATHEFPLEFFQGNLDLMFERAGLLNKALIRKVLPPRVGAGGEWQCKFCEYQSECDTYESFKIIERI